MSEQGGGREREPEQEEQQQGKQGKQGKKGEQEKGGEQGQQKEEPGRVEWVVGIASCVVVLLAVGYLFYRALSGPDLPPLVTVQVERVVPMRSGYLVEIRAANEGTATAGNVMVEGALMRDTVTVEKSTATIDFVPAGTEREGGLYFTRDPREHRLEVRPTGFDRP